MYLLWQRNSLGSLLLSQEGVRRFANVLCEKACPCTNVSLSPADNTLFLVVTMPKSGNAAEMGRFEKKLQDALASVGLLVRVSWIEPTEKSFVGEDELASLVKKPAAWAVAFALVALLLKEGLGTALWCVLWGGLFYAATLFFRSETGSGIVQKLKGLAGR